VWVIKAPLRMGGFGSPPTPPPSHLSVFVSIDLLIDPCQGPRMKKKTAELVERKIEQN